MSRDVEYESARERRENDAIRRVDELNGNLLRLVALLERHGPALDALAAGRGLPGKGMDALLSGVGDALRRGSFDGLLGAPPERRRRSRREDD